MSVVPIAQRAELHVSVSQITTWLMCPRRYEFRYVLGFESEHVSSNLVLGSAVHAALARYYIGLMNGDGLEPAALEQVFSDEWDEEIASRSNLHLPEGVTAGELKDQGIGLVRVFRAEVVAPDKVLAVEQPFATDIADPATGEVLEEQLVGALDAVVEYEGRRTILEHKTAARRWSDDRVDHDLQAGTYLAIADADRLRFQVLVKNRTPVMQVFDTTRSEAARTEAITILCRVLDAIRAGLFWPNRGWTCRGCEYRQQCGP